ncbi:hypothetical protein AXG93_1154s1700 [Marchantia polymorpha subsp. ruderalis]|uniref:Rab escort protein 1 n=1 Tax=Marchantia polymorpha subsp. ruderalis TaxID=1480154 RepID=A0A176WT69_MARPO|nr:hypothetical protein AXG93_1154s1700 [Marchantia polymorpha subsp. ruderalis]
MEMDGLVEPDTFDLIVLGTGLPESILAAAAANAGHSVLHLDHLDFYGAHWTSLSFSQFRSWAGSGGSFAPPPILANSSFADECEESPLSTASSGNLLGTACDLRADDETGAGADHPDGKGNDVSGTTIAESDKAGNEETESARPGDQREIGLEVVEVDYENHLYSDVRLKDIEGVDLGASRFYNLDLAGPRLTFCGSQLVNLLLRSGASNYVEFKGVEATYMWTGTVLSAVPSSRADVFKDKSLSLSDKRFLMRFFKLVTDHANAEGAEISREILESPFVEFMRLQNLPTSMQSYRAAPIGGHDFCGGLCASSPVLSVDFVSIILYAIALVDTDQDSKDSSTLLKTEDGFRKLTLYLSSVGRFSNAPTAFLYPLYGQGELPQAFCRSAAVNGSLYVLRRPIKALIVDKECNEYRGVQTLTGQHLYSKKLIMGPSVVPKREQEGGLLPLAKEENGSVQKPGDESSKKPALLSSSEGPHTKVARYVCITDKSLFEGQTTLLVIFPPKLISENHSTVVRALQLSSAASVCPDGKFVLQLSTLCSDASDGHEILKAAIDILLSRPGEGTLVSSEANEEFLPAPKPKILWSVYFKQALHTDARKLARPGLAMFDMPDGALDCEGILSSTEKVYREFFPQTEFFKKAPPPEEKETEEVESEDVETE